MRRLVEAELPFQLLDEFRRQALRAAVFRVDARVAAGAGALSAGEIAAAAAADPRGGGNVGALDLRDHPLHRAARGELDDEEADRHDPEDRRDHQEETAEDIGCHGAASAGPADTRSFLRIEPPAVDHAGS